MRKVVFVASLAHSGSTLLDLVLGGHSRCVGLGEVVFALGPGPYGLEKTLQSLCSCGRGVQDCPFWAKVVSELDTGETLDVQDTYRVVLDAFDRVFGPDIIAVDSSKTLGALQALCADASVDLSVIHLLRDVRSSTISHIDNARKKRYQRFWRIPIHRFLASC